MKKKMLLYVVILATILIANLSFAASWSVTVTWTKSAGPNLHHEEVFYNNVSKCSVTPPAATTCNFTIPDLTGEVWVRSLNPQGSFVDTSHVLIQPVPAAATGIVVTVTYVP